MRTALIVWLGLTLLASMAACGDSAAPASVNGTDTDPVIDLDPDASATGDAWAGGGGDDLGVGGDACPGGFGCPCVEPVDCFSGYCVPDEAGQLFCTELCDEKCDEGFLCQPAPGSDVAYICVPEIDRLCAPCVEDADCGNLGGVCLPSGRCGRACTDDDCPEGFGCTSVGEGAADQCTPLSGECPCDPAVEDCSDGPDASGGAGSDGGSLDGGALTDAEDGDAGPEPQADGSVADGGVHEDAEAMDSGPGDAGGPGADIGPADATGVQDADDPSGDAAVEPIGDTLTDTGPLTDGAAPGDDDTTPGEDTTAGDPDGSLPVDDVAPDGGGPGPADGTLDDTAPIGDIPKGDDAVSVDDVPPADDSSPADDTSPVDDAGPGTDAGPDDTDSDGDGVPDVDDNCPGVFNPLQQDGDDDGVGDHCDDCPPGDKLDPDSDGACGAADNCPGTPNGATSRNICWALTGKGFDGASWLFVVDAPLTEDALDPLPVGLGTGAGPLLALAVEPGSHRLLAAGDVGSLGWVDRHSGRFVALGPLGQGIGAQGFQAYQRITGLAWDAGSDALWAVVARNDAEDLLTRLDPATGETLPETFGPLSDYLTILPAAPGLEATRDLTAHPETGALWAVQGTADGGDHLIAIDPASGFTTVIAELEHDLVSGLDWLDAETLIGVRDGGGAASRKVYEIDTTTGDMDDFEVLDDAEDAQAIACEVFTTPGQQDADGDGQGDACDTIGGLGFTNVAAAAGVTLPGAKPGGLATADLNGDGALDLFVNTLTGALFSKVLHQVPGLDPTFEDVTAELAPGLSSQFAERSALIADVNHDGHPDLVRNGLLRVEVYLNAGPAPEGGLQPAWSFGLPDGSPSWVLTNLDMPDNLLDAEGLAWLDATGDGWLDLIIDGGLYGTTVLVNPADSTAEFLPVPGDLFGLPNDTLHSDYLATADLDADGLVDILGRFDGTEGGSPDIWFQVAPGEFAPDDGVNFRAPNNLTGAVVPCDFDEDGDFDFFYTAGGLEEVHDHGPSVLVMQAPDGSWAPTFLPVANLGNSSTSAVCGDIDHDGDIDLLVGRSGHDQLYLNQLERGYLRFALAEVSGLDDAHSTEGMVLWDYDRDGDLDVYANKSGANNPLWRNGLGGSRYLMVRVLARVGDEGSTLRDDHGATVRLMDASGQYVSGIRQVSGGDSHGSQPPPLVHFSLPDGPLAKVQVEVRFQRGGQTVVQEVVPALLGAYQLLEVVEPAP